MKEFIKVGGTIRIQYIADNQLHYRLRSLAEQRLLYIQTFIRSVNKQVNSTRICTVNARTTFGTRVRKGVTIRYVCCQKCVNITSLSVIISYQTIMKMMLVKINTRLCIKKSPVIICRRLESALATDSSIVASTAEYPPIQDVSFKARWRRNRSHWHDQVKGVASVEEKMIKINMPRYYGFKSLMYEEGRIFYNELPHVQFITRTHVAKEPELPSYYDNIIEPEKLNSLVEKIKKPIEDGILFQLSDLQRNFEKCHELHNIQKTIDDTNGDNVSKQVNRIMITGLAKEYPHLLNTSVDFDPRIEAFWFAGGIFPTKYALMGIEKRYWNDILDEPIDRALQYIGTPSLQLRHNLPLNEILPLTDCENPEWEIPLFRYEPRTMGHAMKRRHATTIPGFWPSDSHGFGLMSYHKRGYLLGRPESFDDESEALKTQAILSNYAWLLGQASHQGFTTFNDVTYPLVNQSIITNGQLWSFCVYQLNTTLVNGWNSETNPKRNICWMTEPLKLFEKIEDGKLVGFNEDVLKKLIKFYVNVPQKRIGVNLAPFLNNEVPRVACIEDAENRQWLERLYKQLMSNRPRHRSMPEMYHWEKVYKQIFKTRPLEKKRTPWDFGKNPFLRRLDDTSPVYIPRYLRTDRPKRFKYAKSYFP